MVDKQQALILLQQHVIEKQARDLQSLLMLFPRMEVRDGNLCYFSRKTGRLLNEFSTREITLFREDGSIRKYGIQSITFPEPRERWEDGKLPKTEYRGETKFPKSGDPSVASRWEIQINFNLEKNRCVCYKLSSRKFKMEMFPRKTHSFNIKLAPIIYENYKYALAEFISVVKNEMK